MSATDDTYVDVLEHALTHIREAVAATEAAEYTDAARELDAPIDNLRNLIANERAARNGHHAETPLDDDEPEPGPPVAVVDDEPEPGPPHQTEHAALASERVYSNAEDLLGALLLAGAMGPDVSAATLAGIRGEGVAPSSFARERDRLIFAAIERVVDRGEPAVHNVVEAELSRSKQLGDAGGRLYLLELAKVVPAVANAAHYARLVADEARTLADERLALRFLEAARNGGVDDQLRGELAEQLRAAPKASTARYSFVTLSEFLAHPLPLAVPLLGDPAAIYLAAGTLLVVYGDDGSAKSTLQVDAIAHMAAGVDWLGIPVARPVRFCVIENEGPPSLFQQKLDDKAATWDGGGVDWRANVAVYQDPWGGFTFTDPAARAALNEFCDEHQVDVVAANPTLGLGVDGAGKPGDTNAFVELLVECGLKTRRAFWLLHHENKAGQISGDWGRHADTKVQVQQDGKQQRTKLIWEKTRWATLEPEQKTLLLEWVVPTKSYKPVPITPGSSDDDLEARIRDYLHEHPLATTNDVTGNVKGTNKRIADLLKNGPFDAADGPRGAKQWFNADDRSETPDAVPTQ